MKNEVRARREGSRRRREGRKEERRRRREGKRERKRIKGREGERKGGKGGNSSLCSTATQISSSETNSSHSISITRLVLVTQVLNLLHNKVI